MAEKYVRIKIEMTPTKEVSQKTCWLSRTLSECLSICYWEWIIPSSTTFNENESIFKDDFSRIGCLFFKEETNKDACEESRIYYETFEKSFKSAMEILKPMCSLASTNCDLFILSLNIKSQVRPGTKLNRMLRLILSCLNFTEHLHPKWKTAINICIQTRAGVLYAMNFRTFPWYPDWNAMMTLVNDKSDLFFASKYKPMSCDKLKYWNKIAFFYIRNTRPNQRYNRVTIACRIERKIINYNSL